MTTYPDGYGTSRITLDQMKARHGPRMHPEFARRFFAYIEAKGGLLGVGGGWRATNPDKPGFAPDGRSFHQSQTWASGTVGYAAVDLVVGVTGKVHRSPTWAETTDAPAYGLHTFISNEPWHIQPIEIRGWLAWVEAGRRDPNPYFPLPQPPDPNPVGVPDVFYPINPYRNSDTRVFGGPLASGSTHTFEIEKTKFPANTTAVAINLAVVDQTGPGYLTIWPHGMSKPNTSCINYQANGGATNGAIVVGVKDRKFSVYVHTKAHVICDITGYWTN